MTGEGSTNSARLSRTAKPWPEILDTRDPRRAHWADGIVVIVVASIRPRYPGESSSIFLGGNPSRGKFHNRVRSCRWRKGYFLAIPCDSFLDVLKNPGC